MPVFFSQCAILDILERLLWWVLGHETFCYHPLLLLKICLFCRRHSFLRIVAVCWWKNEAYKDWYYSFLLLSVIINSVTFVINWWFHFRENGTHYKIAGQGLIPVKKTISIREKQWCMDVLGPFLALQQFLPILVTLVQFVAFCHISRLSLPFSLSKCRILLNLLFLLFLPYLLLNLFTYHKKFLLLLRFLRNLRTYWSPSWPFLFPSLEFCEICCSCYFCHICCSIFSHSRKNSCYFYDFCEICGHLEALLDLFSF